MEAGDICIRTVAGADDVGLEVFRGLKRRKLPPDIILTEGLPFSVE